MMCIHFPHILPTRASTGPGTGPLSGPGRAFQKKSGIRVLTGPGPQCILQQLEGTEMKIHTKVNLA